MEEDKDLILKNYKSLNSSLKALILDYSEKSTHLSKEELH